MTIEHNQLEAPTEVLAMELADLREQAVQPYLSEERKASINRRIAYLSFELAERAKE